MSERLLTLPAAVRRRTDAGPIIRFGLCSLGGALALFVLWASFVPLASSVVASGALVSDGRNQLVQHPTGGRIAAIHVRPGAIVRAGAPLLDLDVVRARAELTRLRARARLLRAARARLLAQLRSGDTAAKSAGAALADRNGRWRPKGLRGSTDGASHRTQLLTASVPPTDDIEESERSAFVYGRRQVAGELATLGAKIDTLRREGDGLRARIASTGDMLRLARQERDRLAPLVRSGYVARNRLRERKRAVLELEGRLAAQVQDERAVATRIAEIEHERGRVRAADMRASSADLSRISTELAEIADQLVAARAGVEQSVLRAPTDGVVAKLAVQTVGGVVGPGDVVAEVVPDAALEIEARVRPSDIAHVAVGDPARVTLAAFAWRGDEPVPARVTHVEADAQADERTGERYFAVFLRPVAAGAARSDLRAGMQAEVSIRSGERTFMSYLFEPVARSFRKAFRET